MILGRRKWIPQAKSWSTTRSLRSPVSMEKAEFSNKYILFLCFALGGGFLLFALPTLYFAWQNFALFVRWADQVSPDLVVHLEREKQWLVYFLTFSFVFSTALGTWIARRMTQHLLMPLKRLNKHLSLLTEGQYSKNHMTFRTEEDFQQLYQSYNTLVSHLQHETEKEIQELQKIQIDPQDRTSQYIKEKLIESKQQKLSLETKSADKKTSKNPRSSVSEIKQKPSEAKKGLSYDVPNSEIATSIDEVASPRRAS